jgi:cellulose synthase/poly-beta-1,6-N-acetylglucosamine synthase-like glycosyltransferase
VNVPDNPLVSVVIPMYNEGEIIEQCIGSVLNQNYPGRQTEIIVVDGGSTDDSREKVENLKELHPNISLYDNPKQTSSSGLNVGVMHAKGDVIIILGAHALMDREFIRLNISYLREKNVKCVGGTTVNIGKTYTQQAIGLAMNSPFGLSSAPYRYCQKPRFVDTVIYASYRRELFDEVGLFNEEGLISDDAELNWRIREAGHRIFYTPEIKSYYYPRRSLGKLFRQIFRYGILRVNVVKEHIGSIKLAHLVPSVFIISLLGSLALSLLDQRALYLFFSILGVYVLFILLATLHACLKKSWRYFPMLPLIFAVLHISFGLGFIVGIFKRF